MTPDRLHAESVRYAIPPLTIIISTDGTVATIYTAWGGREYLTSIPTPHLPVWLRAEQVRTLARITEQREREQSAPVDLLADLGLL